MVNPSPLKTHGQSPDSMVTPPMPRRSQRHSTAVSAQRRFSGSDSSSAGKSCAALKPCRRAPRPTGAPSWNWGVTQKNGD